MLFSCLSIRSFAMSQALHWAFGYPAFGGTDFCLITRQVTLYPEYEVSSCDADLPGDLALYALMKSGLIALHSGFPALGRQAPDGSSRFRLAFG